MKTSDKIKLAERIRSIEGLNDEERSALLGLLNESKTYGLVWEDKPEAIEERLRTELPVLKEVKSKAIISDNADAPNHIIIEGDNLESLTTLAYTHEGKIDVIYIDPPYNTGNKDFVYNDCYVDSEDSYRHSKSLSFMSRRLRIAKKLLSDRGVIFISIDDNELANLTLLCNDKDLFGEQNHIATICRQAIKGGSRAANIKTVHDYILIYSKRIDSVNPFTGEEKEKVTFDLVDDKGPYTKGRELNKWGAGSRREDSPSMWFPISGPNGEDVYPIRNDGSEGRWRWGKKKLLQAVAEGNVIFEKREDSSYIVYEKVREQKTTTKQFNTWFSDGYINAKGSEALKAIFNTLMSVFTYAKPVELIKELLFMANFPQGVILDFFAGSGTTLHATMALNAEDGGKRQCILCTNNENGICENVTYERNKRVINGYTKPNGEAVEGLHDNNLRYFRTAFVGRRRTPQNMRRLMLLASDMLCIKENLFTELDTFGELQTIENGFRYFAHGDKQMLVIYNEEAIYNIIDQLEQMTVAEPIIVYVFSPGNDAWNSEFVTVSDKVRLTALPSAIYNAYKRVLPKAKDISLTADAETDEVTTETAQSPFDDEEGGNE